MFETRSFLPQWIASLPIDWTRGCDTNSLERARGAYDSPGRHYHTWRHVERCVELLGTFSCENPRAVFLALVFHDAIYVPGRQDNEAQSAALARAELAISASIPAPELDEIARMILATSDHHAYASRTPDEATMLDIDLSILGASRDEYRDYARAIFDEYVPAVASEARFRIGRLEFLYKTAAMEHIFLTAHAQDRWDETARANLAWEIHSLSEQQGLAERSISAIRNALSRDAER